MSCLKDGEAYYRACLQWHTTSKLSPQEVHTLGLEEVARISTNMKAIIKELGFEGMSNSTENYWLPVTHLVKASLIWFNSSNNSSSVFDFSLFWLFALNTELEHLTICLLAHRASDRMRSIYLIGAGPVLTSDVTSDVSEQLYRFWCSILQ